MNFIHKIKYSQNWNVGFCEQTSQDFILTKALKPITWMKHPYKDRWFTDPFILKATGDEIVVFVEECSMDNPKGIICELVVDRRSMQMKKRYVLLELDTHLSYPAIIRYEGKVYVYPENGTSGKLNLYEYDEVNHQLLNPICILDEAVADATILEWQGHYYMVATKYPDTQERAFLYFSDSLFGPFAELNDGPFQTNKICSRPGGGWICVESGLYRPAQDCLERYGSALSIMKTFISNNEINEDVVFSIQPQSKRYSEGIHTINYYQQLCVVDGYGFLFPKMKYVAYFVRRLKTLFA